MSMRLSGINFESFANVEVCNALSYLRMWGTTPMLAMIIKAYELLNEADKDQQHQGYCLLNDLETKLEDLEGALKRLDNQWDQGKLLPARKACEGEEPEDTEDRKAEPAETTGELDTVYVTFESIDKVRTIANLLMWHHDDDMRPETVRGAGEILYQALGEFEKEFESLYAGITKEAPEQE